MMPFHITHPTLPLLLPFPFATLPAMTLVPAWRDAAGRRAGLSTRVAAWTTPAELLLECILLLDSWVLIDASYWSSDAGSR
jgi:hypothetical protein